MKTQEPLKYFGKPFPIEVLLIDGIEVSYKATSFSLERSFSPEKQTSFIQLLEESQIYPKHFYPTVLKWKEEHPSVPELDNLLAYMHLQNKAVEKAEQLIEETFIKYPDYFFAKINYADLCIRKKKLDQIPQIFPSFDLKELFPERSSFHVSEFRGFMVVMSLYFAALHSMEEARKYYQNAYLADPAHPSVIFLEKRYFRLSPIKKFWALLLKLARIS